MGRKKLVFFQFIFLLVCVLAVFASPLSAQAAAASSEDTSVESASVAGNGSDGKQNSTEEDESGEKTKETAEPRKKKKSKKDKESKEDSKEKKDDRTVISIMNALKSGNKKDEKNGDDLLTFEGNVQISVEKNGGKTIIFADRVSYNRKRDMLFAQGAVKLEQTEKNGATQTIHADSLLFNTLTLEGVFDNSRVVKAESNAINLPSGSKITVASDLFARDDSGTIAFKDGSLTFCDEVNPHWKIRASRIWLLPGNEFAFLNALVYVGPVPVLYLPAFYYPKDELIFNPVFGYRNRGGYFFQTTTYLLGRKGIEKDKSSSSKSGTNDIMADYFSLIKPTKLMEQEREGLILHNLDTEFKGSTSDYLKILLDWYSNIGFSTGVAGAFSASGARPSVEGSLILGFSNTVFLNSSDNFYYPFAQSGTTYKDSSNFMGVKMPFRYKGGMKISGSIPFSYSLSIPLYSDPFFDYDFGERSETMDWFSYLLNNPNQDNSDKTESEKLSSAEISSLTWNSNMSYSAKLPEWIKPYISSLSISSFNSSIYFAEGIVSESKYTSEEISDGYPAVTPSRKFFYPSTVVPLKTGLRISGTIFSTSSTKSSSSNSNKGPVLELNSPDFEKDVNSGEDEKREQKNEPAEEKNIPDSETDKADDFDDILLPDLAFSLPSNMEITPFSYTLTYSISPDFASQVTYASEPLKTADDFDWNKLKASYIQVKSPVSLSSSLSFFNNMFGLTNNITFDNLYQKHPYIADYEKDASGNSNGGYTETSKKNLQKTDYAATFFNLSSTNSLSFKPFVYYPHFKNTGLSWNTTIKWLRTKFIGDADNPDWDYLTVDWSDEESITAHTLNATLAASELSDQFSQSLTVSATLPPQVDKYYATLNLKFPYLTLSAESGVSKKSKLDDTWKKEPFKQSASINLFNSKLKFTESFNYELEEDYADSMKFALSYEGLQIAYTMQHTTEYDFDSEKGWIARNDKHFVPYSASLAYATSNKKFKKWKNRIEVSPGLSTSIVYDFVRPTNSYFIFSPSITFRLNKFFYLKFSSTSRNDVIYRYFQGLAGTPGRIPGETNMFKDLINGFRFDDETLRKSSGFKLKSLDITMTHDLHDWDFNMRLKIEPRLVTPSSGSKYYDFSPYFMMSVVWRPMDSIKTKIADKYGDFVLNGSDTSDSTN